MTRALVRGGSRAIDATLALSLFLVAAIVGATYVPFVMDAGGKPRFYQSEFGPAVMAACGRGYVNPQPDSVPGLSAFLATDVDRFSCDGLPGAVATEPLSPMQRAFRYQEMTVAWTWRLTGGPSWRGLAPLYGVFFGATVVAAYALFRTGMNPVLAAGAALALTVSTIHLIYLPHLRDYSKAPFLLLLIGALGWLSRVPLRPASLIAVAAAYGVVLGIGVGFRNDLLIAMPPFVLTVLFFLPGDLREQVAVKVLAVAVCVGTLWLAMWPMRAIYAAGGGNSMPHVLVLGLSKPFNDDLGMVNGDMYDWGHDFKDEYAHAQTSAYATRVWRTDHTLALYGPEYDRAATGYLRATVATFPADMFVRVVSAVLKTLAVPYSFTSLQAPTFVDNSQMLRAYRLRERVLRTCGAVWPWTIGAVLAGLTLAAPRQAAFVALLALYFAAYPVLQFNERHYFHLEFLAWWALGVAVQQVASWVVALGRGQDRRAWLETMRSRRWVASVRTAVVAWVVAGLLVAVPLWALRRYQSGRVRALFQHHLALDREELDRTAVPIGGGLVRIDSPAHALAADRGSDGVSTEYLVLAFAPGACEALQFDLTFRYVASSPRYDFSRTVQVRPPLAGSAARHVLSPVYVHQRSSAVIDAAFTSGGIELPEQSVDCLSGLYRVRDVNGIPLTLDLNLPPAWEQATLYQTMGELERRSDGDTLPDIYTFPPDLAVGRSLMTREVPPLTEADIDAHSSNFAVHQGAWVVDGPGGIGGRGPFLYLARMRPRVAREGDVVVARGRLESGGLSLGLVRNGEWAAQVPVLTPGDFVVVIRVPRDGEYTLVLANNLPGRSLSNRLTLQRIGWLNGA